MYEINYFIHTLTQTFLGKDTHNLKNTRYFCYFILLLLSPLYTILFYIRIYSKLAVYNFLVVDITKSSFIHLTSLLSHSILCCHFSWISIALLIFCKTHILFTVVLYNFNTYNIYNLACFVIHKQAYIGCTYIWSTIMTPYFIIVLLTVVSYNFNTHILLNRCIYNSNTPFTISIYYIYSLFCFIQTGLHRFYLYMEYAQDSIHYLSFINRGIIQLQSLYYITLLYI
jgi:hypothetical protein